MAETKGFSTFFLIQGEDRTMEKKEKRIAVGVLFFFNKLLKECLLLCLKGKEEYEGFEIKPSDDGEFGVDIDASTAEPPDFILLEDFPSILGNPEDREKMIGIIEALKDTGAKIIVIVSSRKNHRFCSQYIEAGAFSLFSGENHFTLLLEDLKHAQMGYVNRNAVEAFTGEIDESSKTGILTDREREVVALIRRGLSNKQIARQLGISPYTVKNHIHNIIEKLGVETREEAADRCET